MKRAKQLFDEDGFVALPGFLAGEELRQLSSRMSELIDHRLSDFPSEHVFFEDKADRSTLKQLQQVWQYDEWLEDLFLRGRFRQLAETLLDGPVVPKNLQWFNKPPRIGRPTPPHQDGYYFMLSPCEAVTMWLALDSTDETNGQVRYVPGSHQRGMRKHGASQTLGFSQSILDFGTRQDIDAEVGIAAEPGDLLAHHALTIHRTHENSSHRHRRALGFIYYAERAIEDKAAHERYQAQLVSEWRKTGKI